MSRSCFAFNKATSPVSRIPTVDIKRYPPAQFMALVQFTEIHFDFDRNENYKPYLIFSGSVESLDTIKTKPADKFDKIYFSSNKPHVEFRYDFSEGQLATLAGKGFWSSDGVRIPELFTSSKFMLEVFATIEEVVPRVRQGADVSKDAPILNVKIEKPYDNAFNENAYELVEFITRNVPEDSKKIESQVTLEDFNLTSQDMLETIKDNMVREAMEKEEEAKQKAAMLHMQNAGAYAQSQRISSYVDETLAKREEARQAARDEIEKAKLEAERAAEEEAKIRKKLEAEQAVRDKMEAAAKAAEDKKSETKIADTDIADINNSNADLFSGSHENDQPDEKLAAFLKSMGAASEAKPEPEAETKSESKSKSDRFETESESDNNADDKTKDKKDDKNGSGSGSNNSEGGAAGGAQTDNNYTFEFDADAQAPDENRDNKASDGDKDNDGDSDDYSNDSESEREKERRRKKKQLEATASAPDMTVTEAAPKTDDRSK